MTKMLDLLDVYLDELGHKCARIDGSVSSQGRQVCYLHAIAPSAVPCLQTT